jgi:hypothetical protein
VVGIGVFVAAIWIVTSSLSFDRTETPAVPGPTLTGPTGSSGPGDWLPPKSTEPSTPAEGDVVLQTVGIHPWHYIQVYADGRVIWSRQTGFTGNSRTSSTTGWLERRLTPEGVDLVRSGAIRLADLDAPSHVPASVWEDPEVSRTSHHGTRSALRNQETMRLLRTDQDLLRGQTDEQAVRSAGGHPSWLRGEGGASEMTIEEARDLDRIFLGWVRNANLPGVHTHRPGCSIRSYPPTGRRRPTVLQSQRRVDRPQNPCEGSDAEDGG